MPSVESAAVTAAIISGTVSLLTAIASSAVTLLITSKQLRDQERQSENQLQLTERRLRQEAQHATAEHRISEERLRSEFQLEFAAERVARALLEDPRWELRTFGTISRHLGGFAADELRKLLVRAGAIRFSSKSGEEIWGLLDRNRSKLGIEGLDDPAPALSSFGGRHAAPASGPEPISEAARFPAATPRDPLAES